MPRSDSASPSNAPAIRKRFIQVGAHRIHYRVAGEGPAIVLLHDSPRSSRLHLDTMRQLAARFRVFALDTPGYGNSSPIGIDAPTIPDFGRLLGETLNAMGLSRAPLYATHTSAKIALDHAANTTTPPAMLLLDGLSIPERAPDEAFIAAYMRPFRIDADGAYLAAEWSRMQDMLRWFPWFDAKPANRIAMDRPDEAWIADYVIDLFSAGPHYSDAYAAALRYDPHGALRRLTGPTVIGARSDDVLFRCLDLLPDDASPSVRVDRLPADRAVWLAWIGDTLAKGAAPLPDPATPITRDGPAYVDLPHGQMLVDRRGGAAGVPLLILEASSTLHAHLWAAALDGMRATIVPDLPGYGESDPLSAFAAIDHYAEALADMAQALGIEAIDILAIDQAAAILALELAALHPNLVRSLAFDGIGDGDPDVDALCPAIEPDHAGGHLHRLWHRLRGGELQSPWYDGRIAAQRTLTPSLAARPLHRALLDTLKQPETYGDAVRAAASCRLQHMEMPTKPALFFNAVGDAGYAGVARIAARFADALIVDRPRDIASAAALLIDTTAAPALSLVSDAL